jgi:hypothetical protein
MKNNNLSPEEKANLALESLDGIHSVEIPNGLEERMLARFDSEFSAKSKTPKWFWAAAVLLLAINIGVVFNYSRSTNSTETSSTKSTTGITSFVSEYFQGGKDFYSN